MLMLEPASILTLESFRRLPPIVHKGNPGYITLNAVRRDLLARAANRVVAHARNTTKDEDIVRRRWCPIDFDAVRPAGISATDGEHQAALDRARQCRDWLCEQGWPEPVFADSGNGAHLLYRIELPNDGPSCELLKHGLEALAFQFGDGSVVVDQATYNASRVWKLYGTLAAKGENLAERPHRLAKLLEVPEQLEVVSPAILEGLAAKLPEAPKTRARPRGDFDLPSWIAEHKLPVVAEAPWSGGHKWVLSPCPWDAGHADRAAYIVQLSNGAIAAGCHHTGCAERDWPALRDLVEPGWGEQAGEREAGSAGECDERPTQAELLVTLGADADVFHSPEGDPYATVPVEEHRETWAVKERPFRLWLVRRFFNRTGRAPNAQALQDALGVFECRARFDGPRHQVFVRVGGLDDTIYLDLANERWEAVEIGPFGWRIISDPPVKFRRTRGMEALPCPVTGGSLAELRPFLNLVGDADWYLCIPWLLCTFRPRGPYPVLTIHGEQGSAKSTTARVLRGMVDPNTSPLRAEPRDERDLVIAASNSWCLCLDNLSHLPSWLSDALCRLSTGGGFSTRQLYTDADEKLFTATRPIVLNGIEEICTRGDLLDRALVLYSPAIPEGRRRTEEDFWAEFERARPRILGALLDGVSGALKNLPDAKLSRSPRMADFALWATAAEPALGWPPESFLQAYTGNRESANDLTLDAALVTPALLALAEEGPWEGTMSRLLTEITKPDELITRQRGWPKTPGALSNALRRLAPNFLARGVQIQFWREKDRQRRRMVRIEKLPNPASVPSERSERHDSSPESRTQADEARPGSDATKDATVRENPLTTHGLDVSDATDANLPDWFCGRTR